MHLDVMRFSDGCVQLWTAVPAWAGSPCSVASGLRAFPHQANDLSKLEAAFFTVNGYISMLFLLFWGGGGCGLARLKLSTDSK